MIDNAISYSKIINTPAERKSDYKKIIRYKSFEKKVIRLTL